MESSAIKKRFIRWMEENRGLILTLIGLPASFIFDTVMRVSRQFSAYLSLPGVDFIKGFVPLRPTFAPCAQLLRSFLLARKFGARRKRWAQGAKPFMKSTPVLVKLIETFSKHLRFIRYMLTL